MQVQEQDIGFVWACRVADPPSKVMEAQGPGRALMYSILLHILVILYTYLFIVTFIVCSCSSAFGGHVDFFGVKPCRETLFILETQPIETCFFHTCLGKYCCTHTPTTL